MILPVAKITPRSSVTVSCEAGIFPKSRSQKFPKVPKSSQKFPKVLKSSQIFWEFRNISQNFRKNVISPEVLNFYINVNSISYSVDIEALNLISKFLRMQTLNIKLNLTRRKNSSTLTRKCYIVPDIDVHFQPWTLISKFVSSISRYNQDSDIEGPLGPLIWKVSKVPDGRPGSPWPLNPVTASWWLRWLASSLASGRLLPYMMSCMISRNYDITYDVICLDKSMSLMIS